MARPLSDADVLLSVGFADYAAAYPDDEVVVYWNTAQFDPPCAAFIRVPRAEIVKRVKRSPPFFRHGDIMRIEAPRAFRAGRDVLLFDKGAAG